MPVFSVLLQTISLPSNYKSFCQAGATAIPQQAFVWGLAGLGIGLALLMVQMISAVMRKAGLARQLAESKAVFEDLVSLIPGCVYQVVDRHDGKTDLKYLDSAVEEIVGLPVEKILKIHELNHLADLVHPDDRQAVVDGIRKAASTRMEWEQEFRIVRPDGKTKWVLSRLKPRELEDGSIYWTGLLLDMTDARQAESTLKAQADEHRAVFQAAPDPMVVYDTEGRVRYLNSAFTRVFGWTMEELVGRKIDYVPEQNLAETMEAIRELYANPSGFIEFESRRITKKGDIRDLAISAAMYRKPDGTAGGMVVNLRDISDQKRAQEERRRLEVRLRQAQKMETIGTLAGGIAHDFNNILAAVIGYAELSLKIIDKESQAYNNLLKIIEAGIRAKDLVHQILAFSRQSEPEMVPVRMAGLVKESLKLLRPTLPTSIEIDVHIGSQAKVLGDPAQLQQVIMNLCANAAQAMEERGGRLSISVFEQTLDDTSAVDGHGLAPGSYLTLMIEDQGVGIAPGVLDRIFDPFFTTKPPGKGTGMGLAVAHGIVTAHGGRITVESAPGRGSVFRVQLPVSSKEENNRRYEEDEVPTGHESILLVDDEPSLVEMTKTILEKLGYKVTAFDDSEEAWTAFRDRPWDFDLLISDMTMPKMMGDQLARLVLSLRPGLPVVILTGYSEKISPEKSRALGVRAVLYKPLTMKTLGTKVRRILDRSKGESIP